MLKAVTAAVLGVWLLAKTSGASASPAEPPKTEHKADHKPDVKADHKAEVKADPKAETKAEHKPEAKAAAKTDHKAAAPPAGQTSGGAPAANRLPGKLPALNTVVETPANRARKDVKQQEDVGPTFNVSALRDELRRSGAEEDRPGSKKFRDRLEQLSRDITKAREALRDDTARLEALMARAEGGGGGETDTGKKAPAPMDVVAKAMRGMKPEQAAPIVSRMEKRLAADVLQRMPAADAGKVMGQLKPETAAELAAEIASRGPRTVGKR